MASIWFRNKAIAWILVFVFAFTTVFSTGTAFAETEKTYTLGSQIEDVGISLWEYSEVWGCNFAVKDNLIVVYGRTGEEGFSYDEKMTLMVNVSDDTHVYADKNGTIGAETSSIRICKMSEDSYYGYLWLSDEQKTVNERYLIKLLIPKDDATGPNGLATDPDGDFTYPDEEIVIPDEEEPYFTYVKYTYNDMDIPSETRLASEGFSYKGETEAEVVINSRGGYGEIYNNITLTGIDVTGDEFEYSGTLDENGECIISFASANGKTYTVTVKDGAYLADIEIPDAWVEVWDGVSWENYPDEKGDPVKRTYDAYVNLDKAAMEGGTTVIIPPFYNAKYGLRLENLPDGFEGLEEVYYLDEEGKATAEFTYPSVNGKVTCEYKINFVMDSDGGDANLSSAIIDYIANEEYESLTLNLDTLMEAGELVYEIPEEIHENWRWPYVYVETDAFSRIQYEKECATSPNGNEQQIEWGNITWFPEFNDDGMDTFAFKVTSADGESERDYRITLTLEGVYESPDEDFAEEPSEMTVIYNERVGEWNIRSFRFDEENYKEVIINSDGGAADGGIIPENIRLTGVDVNGDDIELEGTLDENGECVISFTSANGEEYTVKIIDGAYLIYSDMEFYVNVWDGKSWETIYEEDGSEKEVERTLGICVDLDEAATEEGQTIKIPAFYNENFGIKTSTGVTGFTDYEDVYYLDEDGKAIMTFSAVSVNGKKVYNYKVNFVLDENGGTADLTGVKLMYEDTSDWEMRSIELNADEATESGQLVYEVPAELHENWYMPYVVINTEDFATVQYEMGPATAPDGTEVGSEWGGTTWFPDFGDIGYDTFTFTVTSADGSRTQDYTIILCLEGLAEYPEEDVPCVEHTYGEWEIIEKATCTEPGVQKRICTVCQEEEITAIPVKDHTVKEMQSYKPTCTRDGLTYGSYCDDCKVILVKQEIIPALGHNLEEHDGKAATCTEPGWKPYTVCIREDCRYTTYEEIPATDHNYIAEKAEPTCTDKGYTTYTCVCGDSYVEDIVGPIPHEHDGSWVYDDKEHWHVCTKCLVASDTEAHEITETVTINPTCDTVGEKEYTCETCGYVDYEKIPATGHVMTKISAEKATCEKDGYIEHYICDGCGGYFLDEAGTEAVAAEDVVLEATDHNIGEEPVFNDDEHWYVCSDCHECFDTEEHEITETVTIKPGCGTPGEKEYKCKHCDYIDIKEIPASGEHTYGGWIVDKKATCENAGSKHKECKNCDYEIAEKIPALGHNIIKCKAKASTCTAKGWKAYEECSRCDYTTYKEIKAKGHKWEEFYTIDKKATTKAAGSKSRHCATCNAVKSGSKVTIAKIKKTTANTLVYNGKKRTANVTVVNTKGKKLVKGTDFTVTYKNAKGTKVVTPKNVGTYKAVVKFKGQYSGTVTKTFKINPQGTKITKLNKNGKKQFTVKWTKKTAQVTGYQIRYSTRQNMSNAKLVTVKKANKATSTIKKLKSKQKYYVQIRTYKTVNGTKYYSAWSAKKSITTK